MKTLKRVDEDKGAANSVSFIIIIFFVMGVIFSFADLGVSFNIRNQMQSAAEGGARAVAIYGGTNTNVGSRYGSGAKPVDITNSLIPANLKNNKLITKPVVTCGPTKAGYAGERVWCKVTYTYKGVINTSGMFGMKDRVVVAEGSSVSEVKPN